MEAAELDLPCTGVCVDAEGQRRGGVAGSVDSRGARMRDHKSRNAKTRTHLELFVFLLLWPRIHWPHGGQRVDGYSRRVLTFPRRLGVSAPSRCGRSEALL